MIRFKVIIGGINSMVLNIIAIVISGVSLAMSIFMTPFSLKAYKLQNKVNELDIGLKQNELEQREKENQETVDITSEVVRTEKNKYQMIVQNSGNVPARNVVVKITDGENISICGASNMMPYQSLGPGKSFNLALITNISSANKFKITITWEDKNGTKSTREQFCSL